MQPKEHAGQRTRLLGFDNHSCYKYCQRLEKGGCKTLTLSPIRRTMSAALVGTLVHEEMHSAHILDTAIATKSNEIVEDPCDDDTPANVEAKHDSQPTGL